MAATPCTARDAHRILEAAAHLARTTPDALAAAMVAGTGGTPVPAHIERALCRAVDAGRTPVPGVGPGCVLTPARARTQEALTGLRGCQARLAAAPDDPAAQRAMDDAGYTLCVLMGRATLYEAVLAAEARLRLVPSAP
ncbi:DUF5133 domain-containing protein [Streptomyces sp. NPDC001549]|uniref:DUF5133 domain-containing protein n=1 Tax=Streptomyces sp. NPDC001549 TaxID=3364586 RepID=UPI0036A03922